MTRHYGDRMIPVALVLVSVGLVAAVFAVWSQSQQLRQQQATVNRMLAQSEQAQQEREALRSLVRALQEQVRGLGGQPLTAPPAPSRRPEPSERSEVGPSPRATAGATRSPRPTSSPRPTPYPSVSPIPTSSPSPRVCVGPVCLPPQEVPRARPTRR